MSRTTDATTQLAPFSLHPEHFRLAEAAFHAAGDRPIKICLDVDDTIIQSRASHDTRTVVLNDHLINALTTLLNSRDNLSNVEFFIVSARCDDSKVFRREALLLKKILEAFIPAINEKIKDKHRDGIVIEEKNIHCFQTVSRGTKAIFTLVKGDKVTRRLTGLDWLGTPWSWPEHDSFSYIRLFRNNDTTKGIFFKEFLIPTQTIQDIKEDKEDIRPLFLFFDDNEAQIRAVKRNTNGIAGVEVHCVQVTAPPEPIAAAASALASQPAVIQWRPRLAAVAVAEKNPATEQTVTTTPPLPTAEPKPKESRSSLLKNSELFRASPTASKRQQDASCPCIMM